MTGFTIFCFILLSAALFSLYEILKRSKLSKPYFLLKQSAWQFSVLLLSLISLYLLGLSGSGHHVETDLERTLGEIDAYLLIISLLISFIALIIILIKSIFKRKQATN